MALDRDKALRVEYTPKKTWVFACKHCNGEIGVTGDRLKRHGGLCKSCWGKAASDWWKNGRASFGERDAA